MTFPKQKPLGFRKWVTLEESKRQISKATEGNEFPEKVLDYLSVAFGDKKWESKPWKTPVFSFIDGLGKFNPDPSIPILNAPKGGREPEWEYKGRTWNYYSHLLAHAYGWTLEYIAEMDVNEALGHIQEILTEEHLEQEFYYSLSEVSYEYNKNTKKSTLKPLPRPYWMRPAPKPIKKFKMKRSLLPVGYVVDASGMADELGLGSIVTKENNETQTIDSPQNPPTIPPPA